MAFLITKIIPDVKRSFKKILKKILVDDQTDKFYSVGVSHEG